MFQVYVLNYKYVMFFVCRGKWFLELISVLVLENNHLCSSFKPSYNIFPFLTKDLCFYIFYM